MTGRPDASPDLADIDGDDVEDHDAAGHDGADGVRVVSICDAMAGARLDRALADALDGVSRARIQALLAAGRISADDQIVADASRKVRSGETFTVIVPAPEPAEPEPEAIALAIVHEDAHLIVIDKPSGLVVHPAAGHARGTLVNALLAHCGTSLSGIGGVRRPGIVHRLDKDTSGLIVVAKSDAAHRGLAAQFASHGVDGRLERRYRAFVWGRLPQASVRIEAALGRSQTHRTRMAVLRTGGRHAVTHVAVEATFVHESGPVRGSAIVRRSAERGGSEAQAGVVSELEVRLETGRTHQIRVHLAHIGHPVLGDATYGAGFATRATTLGPAARHALADLGRQALHAELLGFEHPVTGEPLRFHSALPPDIAALARALRAEAGRR